ncbi:uncharacterized protein [Macrobrachium rosenbergii]|uniref:uncharacterized protein isoform X2 n=1 Tax=Macrobrachium rosenbergii TaxID=79674 RepID=UPI0034D718B8
MSFSTQGKPLPSWKRLILVLIQGCVLVSSFPALNSLPHYHLTSPWLKPKISAEALELRQSIARVDETLNRSNDYGSIMLESGEEDDQLSRLLFKIQNTEAWQDKQSWERKRTERTHSYLEETPTRHLRRVWTAY